MSDEHHDDVELRELFAQDARERLDRMTETALALERAPDASSALAGLFRDAHALKGSAPIIGFDVVADTAHELESLLGDLRAGTRPRTARDTDAILGCVDALRTMIARSLTGEPLDEARVAAQDALAAAAVPTGPLGPPPTQEALPAPGPPVPEPPAATPRPAAPVAPPAPVRAPESPATAPGAGAADDTIPVSRQRLDRLVALAGDAVASRLRLAALLPGVTEGDARAEEASAALERTLSLIQAETLATRMVVLRTVEATLRRAVRDVARRTGKAVELEVVGEAVEVDRAVLDRLREPLVHLVRNAVDHGLEDVATRTAAGKPARGTVTVDARRRASEVVITVADDGAGLDLDALRERAGEPQLDDDEAAELVFRPGLSTAGAITDISGRGVGMDAVRSSLEGLRGRAAVTTRRGRGTTFTLTAPVTLAVVRCLIVEAAGERYALPAGAVAVIVDDPAQRRVGLEGGSALWVGEDVVPLVGLADVVAAPDADGTARGPAVVLQVGGRPGSALWVDAVLAQRDVTAKEIDGLPHRNELVAGASIEPDGSLVLLLDAGALVERTRQPHGSAPVPAAATVPPGDEASPVPARRASVLVVDDAITVRELQRGMLRRAGYQVRTATDGRDALAQLGREPVDLVVTDVEMPELDGLGLTRAIRADRALTSLPVLMVTSRDSDEDRRRGLEAGADAYIVKREFDEDALLSAVAALLGDAPPEAGE